MAAMSSGAVSDSQRSAEDDKSNNNSEDPNNVKHEEVCFVNHDAGVKKSD